MNSGNIQRKRERGAALMELAIGALVFFTVLFAVFEFSRLLWTHNALADAVRRGARYAVTHLGGESCASCKTEVKNVVVNGVAGLAPDKVFVTYSEPFGTKLGSAKVEIKGYQFTFSVPMIGGTITLPDYKTSLTAESAGYEPDPSPTATPTPVPSPSPTPP